MNYRVSSNFVSSMAGDENYNQYQKFALMKHEIVFWGNIILDLSGFSMLFAPEEETEWDVSYLQDFS